MIRKRSGGVEPVIISHVLRRIEGSLGHREIIFHTILECVGIAGICEFSHHLVQHRDAPSLDI